MQVLFYLHLRLLYTSESSFLFFRAFKESYETIYRTTSCTNLHCEMRQKDNIKQQELFHLHFTFLYTSVSFCPF